jgi:signal transduction histidine kinase
MNHQWEIICNDGFQFMGKMNASISHEIKNVLAIINENAGLMEDFTRMAEKGLPMDPERIKSFARKIQGQVQRADGIVKNMNTFAHSVDEPRKRIDVGELLAFMTTLSKRLASMKEITLTVMPAAMPLTITTTPFLAHHMIWRCLDFAMAVSGPNSTVEITPDKTEGGARIRFKLPTGLIGKPSQALFPSDVENALADVLNGQVRVQQDSGEIVLILPESIDG